MSLQQKSYTGRNRIEAIRRIFTEGVAGFAKESGCPMGQALSEVAKANNDLWEEYSAAAMAGPETDFPAGSSLKLLAEVKAYAKENKVPISDALCEVSKTHPELWERYREEIAVVV